jgi:tRNA dimethylallyltransferase
MKHLISIVGPTGVGKSGYALHLASRLGCPIISADSVQVYKGLDIGSGKVTAEEQGNVPHFLLDILQPDQEFNAGDYERRVDALLRDLFQTYDQVIIVGGTGFYLQAVWEGFDEMPDVPQEIREALNAQLEAEGLAPLVEELQAVDPTTMAKIDPNNPARVIRALEVWRASGIPISAFRKGEKLKVKAYEDIKIGLELPRDLLYNRIEARIDQMLLAGWLAETTQIGEGFGLDCKGLQALGYREIVQFLKGTMDWETTVDLIKRNTRRYAKRQMTWFRRYNDLNWFSPLDVAPIDQAVDRLLYM